jgi:hypothetical protein
MKRISLLIILAFLLPVTIFAQNVPNGGFESWSNGNPDNWYADNIPSFVVPVVQGTAHSGSFSAKGTVSSYLGGVIEPVLQSGSDAKGFAVTQRFKTVTGYYQFSPVQGDILGLNFIMYKGGTPIASGAAVISASASSWTQFNVDFSYFTNDVPDNCILQILIDGPTGVDYHVGSFFLVDDIGLTGTATSINDKSNLPDKFSLKQNYPNPFNPSTKIQYDLPQNSFVNLKVYNAIGAEVASLVNSVMPAGKHEVIFDASGLKSGVYFYTIKSGGNFIQTKKMILMK